MQVRIKGGKSRNAVFFQWFVAPGGECGAIWPDERWKVARRCGAKHMSKSKCTKHTRVGAPVVSKKCKPLCRKAHLEVKSAKNRRPRTTFGRSDVVSCGRCKGFCTLSKVSQRVWIFAAISKNDGRRGTFEEHLERYMTCSYGRRTTGDMLSQTYSAVREQISWEVFCILAHQIIRFVNMISRDRCSTLHDLASLFRGRRRTLDRWSGKSANRIGTRPSALHSTFHFWGKSRRIFRFWCCQLKKNEEVAQNCFVFDAVKGKKWGSLAELLRFWC